MISQPNLESEQTVAKIPFHPVSCKQMMDATHSMLESTAHKCKLFIVIIKMLVMGKMLKYLQCFCKRIMESIEGRRIRLENRIVHVGRNENFNTILLNAKYILFL